jgi:diguanylate cyclase (GGDEF)-like protein
MKKKSGIFRFLAQTTILPLVLSGIVCCIFGAVCISATVADDAKEELSHLAKVAVSDFDRLYPGDYAMYESDEDQLYTKGDTILNLNYSYIDSLKEQTQIDYTLFYQDTRVLTTLYTPEDERMIGSKANPKIAEAVITNKTSVFYRNVELFDVRYYCYYEPIYNSDGTCVGMLAALMPASRLYRHMWRSVLPLCGIVLLTILIAYIWSYRRSAHLIQATQKLSASLERIAGGNLSNTVPAELLARKDEFGALAHSVVDMQASLRVLVERDALTGLFNRRFGQKRLRSALEKAHDSGATLSVPLGDIDHFKNFNDTYGHDCGDLVLSTTAQLLQDHVKDYGFCSRWGGEEFLVVLNTGTYEEHRALMQSLIETVTANQITYKEHEFSVSMTFGLIDAAPCADIDELLREVDRLLYEGKEAGRNCLVTQTGIQA